MTAPPARKHEIILKELRQERNSEDQRLDRLRVKVETKLNQPREMRAA